MQRFISKSLLFLGILPLLYTLLSFVPLEWNKYAWQAAIIDKHERLNSIPSPRIILSGGSNIAFGIDSEMIEKELGFPVVNLSMQAGFGTSFMLEELKYNVNENDLVILSFEYFLQPGSAELQILVTDVFPEAINYYSLPFLSGLNQRLKNTQSNLKREITFAIRGNFERVYARNGFNEYGDMVSHLDRPPKTRAPAKFKYEYWNDIADLNEFKEYAEGENFGVYYFFPTLQQSQYEFNKKEIESAKKDLIENLKIEILNSPATFVYNDSLYFDTHYHLNRSGREMRTQKMIKLLKNNLNVEHWIVSNGGNTN